jgi:hypothetical protein
VKRIFLVALFAIGLGAPQLSCKGTGPGPTIVNAVVDCTVQNQAQITALIAQFKTLLSGQLPDWAAIYVQAKQAGIAIGGCALAELVQDYLSNKTAPPPQADSWTAAATLDKFRHEVAADATFHTAKGNY